MFHDPYWFDDAFLLDPRHWGWPAPDAGDDPPPPGPHPVGYLLRALWAWRPCAPVLPGFSLRLRSPAPAQRPLLQLVAEGADRDCSPRLQPCRACQGNGMCSGCGGNGRVLVDQGRRLAACDGCVGDGACRTCGGRGTRKQS